MSTMRKFAVMAGMMAMMAESNSGLEDDIHKTYRRNDSYKRKQCKSCLHFNDTCYGKKPTRQACDKYKPKK